MVPAATTAAEVGLSMRGTGDRVPYDARMEPAPDAVPAYRTSGPPAASGVLDERDRAILEFERQWWKYAGAKEQAVRDLFGMSATRYYQVLNALIDRPDALAHDPMLVKRLRRLRASRQRARSARRLGFDA
jgi:Protein of unknown function (DUF3263)